MKYVIIRFSGKQYRVKEGDEVQLAKINLGEGEKIIFKEVLLFIEGETMKIGQPLLKDVFVEGKIIGHLKGKKIRVATYKAKSRYRRVKGFRSQLTKVKIEKIQTLIDNKTDPP